MIRDEGGEGGEKGKTAGDGGGAEQTRYPPSVDGVLRGRGLRVVGTIPPAHPRRRKGENPGVAPAQRNTAGESTSEDGIRDGMPAGGANARGITVCEHLGGGDGAYGGGAADAGGCASPVA